MPAPSAFASSGPVTTFGASNGSLAATLPGGASGAVFIVQSASQPATPELTRLPAPSNLAQFQIVASESAGAAPMAVARSTDAIAQAHRALALDGFRELPPATIGVERALEALPQLRRPLSTLARSAKANLGDRRSFKVLYVPIGGALNANLGSACPNPVANYVCYVNVSATLQAISQHAYVWVDDAALADPAEFPDASYFTAAATNFDRYFAIETQAFGPAFAPANVTQYGQCDANANPLPQNAYGPVPDLTGTDPHIHVLITDVLTQNGEGGYFYSGNLFPQGMLNCTAIPRPVSNELPLLVIGGDRNPAIAGVPLHNPQYWLATDMPRALAHELQH
ncbi:MAG: hypothetical protein JO359_11760, partial [Candidatus Eremiobacteraeota bacterium]|nr:hypothetical protein [Candidatus Eremiobacteraeota bacterium]